MRVATAQKLSRPLVTIGVSITVVLVMLSRVHAAPPVNYEPYFRVAGSGDIFAGGGFVGTGPVSQPCSGNYQSPTSPGGNNYSGAILSFASSGTRQGAGSEQGAFGLGTIEGSSPSDYGFYSGSSGTGPLSFANVDSSGKTLDWGGLFEGGVSQGHCIPNYYISKQLSTATPLNGGSLTSTGSGQYTANASSTAPYNLNNSPDTISVGKSITLFVKGNVYIGNNISYASGYTAADVPKFALVVYGSIYIGPNVSLLDGLYIAQPDPSVLTTTDNGIVWTCHDNSSASPPQDSWVKNNCSTGNLVINGAVIAKQLNLLRLQAGLNSSNPSGAAEVINYTPEMFVGGPFFNPGPSSGTKIDSVISLPPVF